jgi:hypothetical protein
MVQARRRLGLRRASSRCEGRPEEEPDRRCSPISDLRLNGNSDPVMFGVGDPRGRFIVS